VVTWKISAVMPPVRRHEAPQSALDVIPRI
jgi:hypothetical protein